MANIVYIRVSTKEQNTARQFADMKAKGIDLDKAKIFEEHISGKDTNRPQLQAMFDYLRSGDTVFVESLSRLARSTKDLLEITERLNKMEVHLISLKENIDTSTPQGRLIFTVFSAIAQFERECIKERQAEGIALAVENGTMGRPKIAVSETWADNFKLWKDKQITASEFMDREQLKKTTFYKLLKEYQK